MAVLAITFSGGIGMILSLPLGLNSLERNDIVLLPLTLGLKAQKHLALPERQSRPELMYQIIFALQGQKRSYALSVRRKVVIVLHFATPINFTQANYLIFGNHSISVIQTKHHIQNICMLQIYYRQFIVRPSCRYSQAKA